MASQRIQRPVMRPAVGKFLKVAPAGSGRIVGVRRALGTGAIPTTPITPMFSTALTGNTSKPLNT